MSLLSDADGLSFAVAPRGGGALLVLLWLGWRMPTRLLLLLLAWLAIRPQLLRGGLPTAYR